MAALLSEMILESSHEAIEGLIDSGIEILIGDLVGGGTVHDELAAGDGEIDGYAIVPAFMAVLVRRIDHHTASGQPRRERLEFLDVFVDVGFDGVRMRHFVKGDGDLHGLVIL
jgi:hypothetical protein